MKRRLSPVEKRTEYVLRQRGLTTICSYHFFIQHVSLWLSLSQLKILRVCCKYFLKQWANAFFKLSFWEFPFRGDVQYNTRIQIQNVFASSLMDFFKSEQILSSRVKSLEFNLENNKPETENCIPQISCGSVVYFPVPFPPSVTHLNLSWKFDAQLDNNVLPTALTFLNLGWQFNQPIHSPNILPSTLKTLIFGLQFNQTIGRNILPTSLQTLRFSEHYQLNLEVGVLPSSLTNLILSSTCFNLLLPDSLPSGLLKLEIVRRFCSDEHEEIEQLRLLPQYLQFLSIKLIEQIPQNSLPAFLTSLQLIDYPTYFELYDVLPSTLVALDIQDVPNSGGKNTQNKIKKEEEQEQEKKYEPPRFSQFLTHLRIRYSMTTFLFQRNIVEASFSCLTNLTLGGNVFFDCRQLYCLPTSLKFLNLRSLSFNVPLDFCSLLVFLEHFILSDISTHIPKNIFPISLTELQIGSRYNEPLEEGVLPPKLTHLAMGVFFEKPILRPLPSSLTFLDLGCFFNQPINTDFLPSSLTYLNFGTAFCQRITKSLPPLLETVYFGHDYPFLLCSKCIIPVSTRVKSPSNFCYTTVCEPCSEKEK